MQVGDALLSIGSTATQDLGELAALIARLPSHEPVPLLMQRGAQSLELTIQPEALPLEQLDAGEVVLDEVNWREHRLRAVWTFPDNVRASVAIWMLPGAAWLSEEHPSEPRSARLALVRGLTRAGFATLRVDRSGLGDSEGPLCTELDLQAELEMWQAASQYFRRHPRVRADGHCVYARSLGGILAPLVLRGDSWAGVAVWGTSVRRWRDGMRTASERQYALAGQQGPELGRKLERLDALHALVFDLGLTPEQAFERRPDLRDLDPVNFSGRYVHGRVAAFFQELNRSDVAAAWARVQCPVLALHGSSDWLSFAADSQQIAKLAPRGRYLELAGIDHMMHARPSAEAAFAEPWEGDFNPAALEALVAFYTEHC